ncbi:LamG domain-containing protein [Plantibacter sp. Leaf314]|uniref:LamG domain-containing protein n=1 Tax=Plantibacter sp. Leaf314 TaxID=1736333 RepID=UPI0009E959FE|nr:LamG domain-containing protein [Plantibacter sp. Leaf314]
MSSLPAARGASDDAVAPALRRLGRVVLTALATAAVVGGTLVSMPTAAVAAEPAAAAATPLPTTVAADALPTAQMDGVAWGQAVAGNTVFVGGDFAKARPAGAAAGVNTVDRKNLMAYTISTGVMTSWNPSANGVVNSLAVSPDGSRLYVGGTFTTINGVTRNRVAAFDTATGALISSFAPVVNGKVMSVKATNSTVYIGGEFTSVGGATRTKVAAVSASTGALLPFTVDLQGGWGVRALVVSPDGGKLVIGGSFTSTNGSTSPGRGLSAVDAVTGATMPFGVNSVIHNGGENSAIYSLASDGTSVYGTGYDFYGDSTLDDFEGTFKASWSDGTMQWMADCHGDTYSVDVVKDIVYTASHAHYCGNIGGFPQPDPWVFHHSLAFSPNATGTITPDVHGYRNFTGNPSPSLLQWYPTWQTGTKTKLYQAGWSVVGAGDYVLYAGEFLGVSGAKQQGLVRFATRDKAPNKRAPEVWGDNWKLTALSFRAGQVRLSWPANYDPDDATLTYQIFRQDKGTSVPIYTTTETSNFWTQPAMLFTDTNVTAGQTYNYRVKAIDPWGNSTQTSTWVPATATGGNSFSSYNGAVLDAAPSNYWPLGESSGTSAYDWASGNDLTLASPSARAVSGPNLAQANTATSFGGTSSSFGVSSIAQPAPNTFSVEAWFQSSSTQGGKIVGYGNAKTGNSGSYDRQVYLDTSGSVVFGVYPGSVRTVQSAAGFNDGQWHHVVASMGADGMTLSLDGKKVASRADTTTGQDYSGYWRVGGDNIGGWPGVGSSYLDGSISDVAVYPTVLNRATIDAHWVASGRTSTVPAAPADTYGQAVFALDPDLYWRLNESTGPKAADSGPLGNTGTYWGDVSKQTPGALSGVTNTAATFSPNGNSGVGSDKTFSNPRNYAVETWFKTDTTSGGKLIGFGNRSTDGTSNNYDRHVYMTPDGRLNFGVYTGNTVIVSSPSSYNDNTWHHVVAEQSSTGMQLYVDGSLVASGTETNAQDYTGYWRIGGDSTWGGDNWFRGSLDEFAVYGKTLTAAQISDHYSLGKIGRVNALPTAAFTATPSDLGATFDAAGSTDSDGTIASYAWDFGDGTTGSGVTATHTYGAAGSYAVKLTVTDDLGASTTRTEQVTVVAPNVAPTAIFSASVANLALSVDASSSADPDGTIASYAWNFGDGTSGVGATASHTYATAGSFTVTLTVTDNRGASATSTQQVATALPPNQLPTAAFTQSKNLLTVSVDAATSTDTDGSITGYAWDFGDTTTATGKTASHSYAAAGTYTITLTVTDDRAGTAITSQTVTVAPAPNVAPTASFTSSANLLVASFDGSASTDTDGSIASYAWAFGDGTTGTGATAQHSYAAAGTYSVVLTVTDNRGGTATATRSVTVAAAPTATVLAQDDFERTSASGWGSAPVGGAWSLQGAATTYSVGDGSGIVNLAKLDTRAARLGAKFDDAVTTVSFSVDRTGPGYYVAVIGRQVGANAYTARVRWEANGQVRLYLLKNETQIVDSKLLDIVYAPGDRLTISVKASGTSPTTLGAKVWKTGTTEPSAWQLSGTDTDATMQATGQIGLISYLSNSSASATAKLRIEQFTSVTSAAATPVTPPAPPANVNPVSAFTMAATDLSVTFNGSTSSDSDGSIASYAWTFGDGATATGATATHAYAAAGAYPVTLTVTDNRGGTHTSQQTATVSAPVPPVLPPVDPPVDPPVEPPVDPPAAEEPVALDDFDNRQAANGWGAAEEGGAWSTTGPATSYSVANGVGKITANATETRSAVLAGVSIRDALVETTFSVDKAPAGGAHTVTIAGRKIGNSVYSTRVRLDAAGLIRVYILRDETPLADSYVLPGGAYVAGQKLHVTLSVTGAGPTTVQAKVWRDAETEPAAWQLSATDATTAMQAPGAVGVITYVTGANTNGTTTLSVDSFKVTGE